MPFIGKDWRSPGEAWVKTESLGWQRLKLIESQLCHEPTTACTWPPKCEYGQHMVHNCNSQLHNILDDSRDLAFSPGSSDSGRGQSVSPSPSCSPEKAALINHNNHNYLFPLAFSSPTYTTRNAPFCPISIRTREVAIYNTISEAFYRLDFCNAVHDIRRFNYVCKLLHLMITQYLTSLSGCATKVLFNMLEQIAREVSANKRNIHVLRDLLNELKMMIQKYSCWGRPIGSSQLWQQHFDTIERISQMIDNIELAPGQLESQSISFNELPVEMIREIILRLNDYRDLINSARASPVMEEMILSQNVWERMCRYHFTEKELKTVLDGYKRTPQHRRPVSKYVRIDPSELRKQSKKDAPRVGSTTTTITNTNTHANSNSNSKSTPTPTPTKPSGGQIRSHPSTSSSSSEEECQLIGNSVKCNNQKQNRAVRLDSKDAASSYVNRTRKFFDSKSTEENIAISAHRQTGLIGKKLHRSSDNTKRFKHNNNDENEEVLAKPTNTTARGQVTAKPVNERQQVGPVSERSQELDWEDVFHQLRKRFNLKEEYPDCLSLCRHCRCLFWKSIGHPCIEGAELDPSCLYHPYLNQAHSVSNLNNSRSSNIGSSVNSRSIRNHPQSTAEDRRDRRSSVADLQVSNQSGISVAALSRNFDNQIRNGDQQGSYRDILRERRTVNNEINNRRGSNSNNNSNNNLRVNSNSSRPVRRRGEDLVPKHVAISPQAFLKFFSL